MIQPKAKMSEGYVFRVLQANYSVSFHECALCMVLRTLVIFVTIEIERIKPTKSSKYRNRLILDL
jgi:hypothetical protein